MMIFGIVFVVMILAVVGMAIGVLAGRRSLEGSCGGLKTIQGLECMVCPIPCETKEDEEGHGPHNQIVSQATDSDHDHFVIKPCHNKKNSSSQTMAIGRILCN